jgi:hypothetical protein
MSKISKYIPVFFLWLAWLVITAHLIIPHDHHLSDTFACQEDSSHGISSKTGHHPAFPVHCHAFNDLASEKATAYSIIKNIQLADCSIRSFPDLYVFESQIPIITIFDICKSFPDLYLLESSLLRAPPSLS